MLRESLGLFLLLLLTVHLAASECSRHAHCDDGNPDTHDVCVREHSLCMSFSAGRQSTFSQRSLDDLIRDLNAGAISTTVKKRIAKTAGRVLGEWNPNLFVYRNVAGTDPSVRLRRYARTIGRGTSSFEFHKAMGDIFRTANDFHTVYLLPAPFNRTRALLGFDAQVYYVNGDNDKQGNPRRRYVVDDIVRSLIPTNSSFGVGAELLTYNSKSIDAAVLAAGDLSYGANQDAQVAEGVGYISKRMLGVDPVPGSAGVTIRYRADGGAMGTITLPWVYVQASNRDGAAAVAPPQRHKLGTATAGGLGDGMWGGGAGGSEWKLEVEDIGVKTDDGAGVDETVRVDEDERQTVAVGPQFQRLFFAETIRTKSGRIGRLQIRTFNANSNNANLGELARLLRAMPAGGLVVDVRGNPGGNVAFTEDVSNVVTGGVAPDFLTSWRGTALVREAILALALNLTVKSSTLAAVNSAISVREPMSGPAQALFQRNELDTGGFYAGQIVTLTDAQTYSAGDVYAALQVDLGLSTVVGEGATGGGGATTLSYDSMVQVLGRTFQPLGTTRATFSSAFFRFFRYGIKQGALIENVGVAPDVRYFPTRDDALKGDCDLYEMLGLRFSGA